MAIEWISTLWITAKVIVYSYGIVLLEIVLGREVLDLAVDADSDEEVHKVLKKLVARFLICWIESNHQLSISLWISD